MKVRLNNVRLAFANLFEARTVQGEGDPAFSASFLLDPKHPDVKTIRAAVQKAAEEKWGAKAPGILKTLIAKDKTCLHDGADKADKYDGFEGMLYVSARGKVRPTVIDTNKSPLTAQDGRPYSGCYVNAVLDLWAQDNQFGKRVNAQLAGVQFHKEGDAFGGGKVADADDFDDVSVEDADSTGSPWGDDDDLAA